MFVKSQFKETIRKVWLIVMVNNKLGPKLKQKSGKRTVMDVKLKRTDNLGIIHLIRSQDFPEN